MRFSQLAGEYCSDLWLQGALVRGGHHPERLEQLGCSCRVCLHLCWHTVWRWKRWKEAELKVRT